MVRFPFPGDSREWNLLVADVSVPVWERFTDAMRRNNYLFLESAGGTYNCRKVNTPSGTLTTWSLHSYGIALDLNPSQNPYRKPLTHNYPASFIADVEAIRVNGKKAFQWGGRWSTPDAMHWQLDIAPGDIQEEPDMASPAMSMMIDLAFSAGWAQGDPNYWHSKDDTDPEFADLRSAVRRGAATLREIPGLSDKFVAKGVPVVLEGIS